MANNNLANRFMSHTMTDEATRKSDQLRTMAHDLATNIDICCSESREKSLALTKLEECLFWCNADLSRNKNL